MTEGRGEMREVYPVAGETYRYLTVEEDGRFTFETEGEHRGGQAPNVRLIIQSGEHRQGISRDESGRAHTFAWAWVGTELHLWLDGQLFVFQRGDPSAGSGRRRGGGADDASGDILAPMPGAVLEVLVAEGDRVERNQSVAIMESMKMELVITAPCDGVVRRISVQPGQQVERGMRLMELTPEGDAGK